MLYPKPYTTVRSLIAGLSSPLFFLASFLLYVFKPRLHERFFACDGDAIFLKIVASPACEENRMCSHPRTGDATDEKIAEKNREKFNELNFLRLNHGLVRGWLHRRFSPRAGKATISKKSHHHRKQQIARVAVALVAKRYDKEYSIV